MTPGDVSVIIPTLNEADHIASAIQSVWRNHAGQVIVCDGGSNDDTVGLSTRLGAGVVVSGPGRGVQLAAGADKAQGRILLFLHADNALSDNCLETLCRAANHSRAGENLWGGFEQRIDGNSPLYRALEWGNAARIRFRGIPFGDQAMFVTRSLYDRVGGFQSLPLMEDVNLAKSLRKVCWPMLIRCAISVNARRWEKRGVVRQTLRNWGIQIAHGLGVSEHRLSNWYR
ncbi:MAG: TIGR04283 family arsenosugar biosynthesis glycosyltransferase [Planctomycetales bacterium]|nr:TIGR04283 family arsenosugar biosynthesis glycosyltransferase [Planctomycetales bacterium]